VHEKENMSRGLVAEASISVNASVERVWNALIDPEVIKQHMFGTSVVSDWKVGSQIVWNGEWQGRKYEDRGAILRLQKDQLIEYTHFSPISGKPDLRENHHKITIELVSHGKTTTIRLRQDNNETEEENEHSQKNWKKMLEELRKLLEK